MRDRLPLLLLLILGALALWLIGNHSAEPDDPARSPQPCPICPAPQPEPTPKPPRRPWGPRAGGPVGSGASCDCDSSSPSRGSTGNGAPFIQASLGGPSFRDGTEIQCDLPADLHLKNSSGRDGMGLCVFASVNHSAYWQHVAALQDFLQWMRRRSGGGYPRKVDQMIEEICKEKGVPKPDYIQIEGGDLEILKLACKNGLMPAVTYSFSPSGRYGGRRISHMVSLVHADDQHFVILDNNFPDNYEWMSPQEFQKTYTGGRSGWSVILLHPGPPLPPKNQETRVQP